MKMERYQTDFRGAWNVQEKWFSYSRMTRTLNFVSNSKKKSSYLSLSCVIYQFRRKLRTIYEVFQIFRSCFTTYNTSPQSTCYRQINYIYIYKRKEEVEEEFSRWTVWNWIAVSAPGERAYKRASRRFNLQLQSLPWNRAVSNVS